MKQTYFISLLVLCSISLTAQCGGGGWHISDNKIGFGVPAVNKVSAKISIVDGYPAIVFDREVTINSIEFSSKQIAVNTYSNRQDSKRTIDVEDAGDQLLIVDDELYEKIYNGWYIKFIVYITVDGEVSTMKICKCFE